MVKSILPVLYSFRCSGSSQFGHENSHNVEKEYKIDLAQEKAKKNKGDLQENH